IISVLNVINLVNTPEGQSPFIPEPTGIAPGGNVIVDGGAQVVDTTANENGIFNNSPGDILTGFFRPGAQELTPLQEEAVLIFAARSPRLIEDLEQKGFLFPKPPSEFFTNEGFFINDLVGDSPFFADTDPLVLDVDGNGITLSNIL